jgi:hypothetical protein
MMAFHKDWKSRESPYTLLEMSKPDNTSPNDKLSVTPQHVDKIFDTGSGDIKLKGIVETTEQGQKLTYVQRNLEFNQSYLTFMLVFLYNLIRVYPAIVALGGEIIPLLHSVATTEKHRLQSVAKQLITETAATTHRLAYRLSGLVCRHCLLNFAEHKVDISRLQVVTYYGCPQCHRSIDYFEVRQVIAVLDQQMLDRTAYDDGILRINWLRHRHLFNFNAVEIVNAIDEDTERFAVQVGNDTDPVRKPGYPTMLCKVWAGCNLSKNTMRILRRTFGAVELNDYKKEDNFG